MKTLIQIGTNVGSDDFQSRCNKLTEFSKIILIEPHEKLNESIKRNYFDLLDKHEIIIVNKAIVPNEEIKEVELYYIENKEGFSSLINRKSFLLNQKKIVESISLNSLLDSMNLKEVSELHIDAEGLDYEILLSLDLVKYNIELITCEIWPYSKDDSNDN